jgi:hypothetical protein
MASSRWILSLIFVDTGKDDDKNRSVVGEGLFLRMKMDFRRVQHS